YYPSHWDDSGFYPIHLLSVADADGKALPFIHKRDQLLVSLPRPTQAGTSMTLQFRGSADVIEQLTAESFGLLEAPWYPQYGYRGGRFRFHWNVRVPERYQVTGSGNVVREFADKEAGQVGLEVECRDPAMFPWIIFGRFQKATSTYLSQEA